MSEQEIQPQTQQPVAEQTQTATTEAPPENPEEKRFASRFAALSKREKAAVQREQAAKAAEETLRSKEAKINSLEQLLSTAKDNPIALLEAAGLSMDDLVNYHIRNAKEVTPEDKIAALEAKVQKELESRDKARQEEESKRKQVEQEAEEQYIVQMIESYHKEVNDFIDAHPEEYETILAYNAKDEVFSLVRDHFAETGTILSPEDAAKQVEAGLLSELEKVLSLKKLQSKIQPPKEEITLPQRKSAPTLSSSQVLSDPIMGVTRRWSNEERMQRAAAKLQFVDRK